MKSPKILTLGSLAIVLASCGSLDSLKQPLSGDGNFDPLGPPGPVNKQKSTSAVVAPSAPSYTSGQWVETSMDGATFFRAIPKGNASADKVLSKATPMKVVSGKGAYVKVELDSGDIGFVPGVFVTERGSQDPEPTDYGPVPPPIEPGIPGPGVVPPPEVPGTPPPVPGLPPAPSVPSLPDDSSLPTIPSSPAPPTPPTVPDIAPPPTVPGITE